MQHLELAEERTIAEDGENKKTCAVDHVHEVVLDEVDVVYTFAGLNDCLVVREALHVQTCHNLADKVFVLRATVSHVVEVDEEELKLLDYVRQTRVY